MNSNQRRFLYAAWLALTALIAFFLIQTGDLVGTNWGGILILVLSICGCGFAVYLWVHKNQETIDKWIEK